MAVMPFAVVRGWFRKVRANYANGGFARVRTVSDGRQLPPTGKGVPPVKHAAAAPF